MTDSEYRPDEAAPRLKGRNTTTEDMAMRHRAVKIFLAIMLHIIYCDMAVACGYELDTAIVHQRNGDDRTVLCCGERNDLSRCDTIIRSVGSQGYCGAAENEDYSKSVLIIFYEDATAKKRLRRALRKMHCETIYEYHNFNAMAVRIPESSEIMAVADRIRKIRGVLTVERDRIMHLD
ncbi:MAG: hypothetical protein PUD58_02730 [Prevotella sp.]|nr:hypothetical protein [Prevotella sp.]